MVDGWKWDTIAVLLLKSWYESGFKVLCGPEKAKDLGFPIHSLKSIKVNLHYTDRKSIPYCIMECYYMNYIRVSSLFHQDKLRWWGVRAAVILTFHSTSYSNCIIMNIRQSENVSDMSRSWAHLPAECIHYKRSTKICLTLLVCIVIPIIKVTYMVQNNMQIYFWLKSEISGSDSCILAKCEHIEYLQCCIRVWLFYIVLETFGTIFKPMLNWKEMSSTVQAQLACKPLCTSHLALHQWLTLFESNPVAFHAAVCCECSLL